LRAPARTFLFDEAPVKWFQDSLQVRYSRRCSLANSSVSKANTWRLAIRVRILPVAYSFQ
jgi:hypothetical protein